MRLIKTSNNTFNFDIICQLIGTNKFDEINHEFDREIRLR